MSLNTLNLTPIAKKKKTANKAMSALKLLHIVFNYLSKSSFNVLYTAYVRPHLDCCAQAVGTVFKQDVNAQEKVQRRVKKLPTISIQGRLW